MAGGGSAHQSSGAKKARIEIIPLIDVVFFLLATFVLFTLSLNKIISLPVNMPVPSPKQEVEPEEPTVIQVTDGDSVYWNKELISMSEVLPKLVQYKGSTQNPRVLITGDDKGKFGALAEVLDHVREADIKQVSMETAYRASGR